jgi:hypothetical protein
MDAPTYTLRPSGAPAAQYARDVARLADEVLAAGEALRAILERHAAFVAASAREPVRSAPEYLLEALALGVLWRARAGDALRDDGSSWAHASTLAARRRAGGARPRDGSNALILALDRPFEPGHASPTLAMVGAELLNRAWRAAFARRRRHVVVMPGCMRARDEHWRQSAVPTSIDVATLRRILPVDPAEAETPCAA